MPKDKVDISIKKLNLLISMLDKARDYMDRPYSPSGELIREVIFELRMEREKK